MSLFCLGGELGGLALLLTGDPHGAGGVAGDVEGGTAHVEQLVDARDDRDAFDRQADRLEHHRQHDHARAGDTGGADGCERRRQDNHGHLAKRQVNAVAAGDEDRRDGLIDSCAVHVDRRAERQDEGGDVVLNAHLIAALLGDRQGRHRGRGRESEDSRGEHALEELDRAHLREDLDRQAVDQHDMDDVAEIGNANDDEQVADDGRAVDGDDVCHQAEDADRGELDDHHHDLHDDFFHAVDKLCDLLALLTGGQDARAEEDGDDDDRQHVGVDHGLEEVIGEDVHDDLHDGGGFLGLVFQAGGLEQRECALENVGQHEADDDGDGGREHVVHERPQADRADALEILQGDDAVSDREQNDGHNEELQQVDVDRADGLDPLRGKIAETGERENEARNDTGQHADEDPCRQTELLLFFHAFLLLFFFEDIPQIALIIP